MQVNSRLKKAHIIKSYAKVKNGQVVKVRFENVPSFVQSLDTEIDVPGLGMINYDLAFGGAFYAFVDVAQLDLDCKPEYQNQLIETGMKIKHAIMDSVEMATAIHIHINNNNTHCPIIKSSGAGFCMAPEISEALNFLNCKSLPTILGTAP